MMKKIVMVILWCLIQVAMFANTSEFSFEWLSKRDQADSALTTGQRSAFIKRLQDEFNEPVWNATYAEEKMFNGWESNYYFNDASFDSNCVASNDFDPTDDYLCIGKIKASCRAHVSHKYTGLENTYFKFSFGPVIKIFDDNKKEIRKLDKSRADNKNWWQPKGGGVEIGWHYKKTFDTDHLTITALNSNTNELEFLYPNCFIQYPGEARVHSYYTLNYALYWHWFNAPENQDVGHTPAWLNERRHDYYLYKAIPIRPVITQNTSQKIFYPDASSVIPVGDLSHDVSSIDIGMNRIRVKIYTLTIYKKEGSSWMSVLTKTHKSNGHFSSGIPDISLYKADIATFNRTGEYQLVLGAIDKFNKIYVFEPTYFTIDKTPPTIAGLWENPDSLSTSPVFASFNSIADNGTTYTEAQLKANLRVVTKGSNSLLTEAADLNGSLFEISYNSDLAKWEISVTREDKFTIDRLYVTDQYGNETEILVDKTYSYDASAPVIEIENSYEYYGDSPEYISIKADDAHTYIISAISVTLGTTSYTYPDIVTGKNLNSYVSGIRRFTIPTGKMAGKEGNATLTITGQDELGNSTTTSIPLKIDISKPRLTMKIGPDTIRDSAVEYNLKNQTRPLTVAIDDYSFDKVTVTTTSSIPGSSHEQEVTGTTSPMTVANLGFTADTAYERLVTRVQAQDKAGNAIDITKTIHLYSDGEKPLVAATKTGTNSKLIDTYDIEVTDESPLKEVWYKQVDTRGLTDVEIKTALDDYVANPDTGWFKVSGVNGTEFTMTGYNLISGSAACFYAVDHWGFSHHALIKKNEVVGDLRYITSKADLADFPHDTTNDVTTYRMYGVIVFKLSTDAPFVINANEVLLITAETDEPVVIIFDDLKTRTTILNKGTIRFNPEKSPILLTGKTSVSRYYQWFGIKNDGGEVFFDSTAHPVTFRDAEIPLTFIKPTKDVIVSKTVFDNCLMGIHMVDDGVAYQQVKVSNCTFRNLAFGIKLDLVDFTSLPAFTGTDKVIDTGCVFEDSVSVKPVFSW